ncbi:MAG: MFS transporter [Micromonosporaceae bacterium]|nr:MFS transporter [Micromonosporaceae bacterium]
MLAGVFVNRLAGFLQIFLVLFITDRGFSTGQAGLALGLWGAGGVLGTILGGYLSDRLSARAATLISMLGSAALLISILYIGYYPLLLLVVILAGIVTPIYRPAAQTMITEVVPRSQLVMVTAMYRLCLNLGTTAAPLLGVALVSVSYDLLFWGEALAALIYGLIAVRFLPRRVRPPGEPAAEPSQAPSGTPAKQPRSGYRAVLSDTRYVFYLAAVFLIIVVHVQYTASLPLAIVDADLNLWWYGAVVALNAALVVTVEVPATKWVQAWPLPVIAVLGFGLFAVGYGMYAIAIVPVFLILGTLIWTSSEIIGGPTTNAYPGMIAPAHLRGRYFGAMQSAVGLGFTVGPVAGVALWNLLGQGVWLWAAGVAVLSAICARIGMRAPSKPPTEAEREPAAEPAG